MEHVETEPGPTESPPRWFNIDGSRHSIGDTTDCGCSAKCEKCGAREHQQDGYGCLYRFCEHCDIADSTGNIAEAGEA